MTLQAFSTDDDQDLIGEAFSFSEARSAAMLEEMMSGADEEALEEFIDAAQQRFEEGPEVSAPNPSD